MDGSTNLAEHPVIKGLLNEIDRLKKRMEYLETELSKDHEKLEKLEHEVVHDHEVIEKLGNPATSFTKRPHVTVGL